MLTVIDEPLPPMPEPFADRVRVLTDAELADLAALGDQVDELTGDDD